MGYKIYLYFLWSLKFSLHRDGFNYNSMDEEQKDFHWVDNNECLSLSQLQTKILQQTILINSLKTNNKYLLSQLSSYETKQEQLQRNIIAHIGIHIINLILHLVNLLYIVKAHCSWI